MIYPIDPTGISPSNRIIDETKVIMPPGQITDASFFVPRVNPFFRSGLVIKQGTRTLIENVDYQLVFRSVALSEHFEKELFGGVMLVNRYFEGTVTITYQVLGGDFQNDEYELLERLARISGAIRWVTYDQLIGTPSNFPPAYHMHDIETDLVDMGDVVDVVERMVTELSKAPASLTEVNARISSHLMAEHAHSKAQVSLGDVENLPIASDVEVSQGVRKYVTADALKRQLPTMVAGLIIAPPPPPLPPVNQTPMEHQPTIDKITDLTQTVTNLGNSLAFNSSADSSWRTQHVATTGDPHPQYVTSVEVAGQLGGVLDRLTNVEQKVNAPAPADGTGALRPIKAWWSFGSPYSTTNYRVSGAQPGLPIGIPLNTGELQTSYSAIQVVDVSIEQVSWRTSDGGGLVYNNAYHLKWIKFTCSFEFDLSQLTCMSQFGSPISVTKSGNVYSIVLPPRTNFHQSTGHTPLVFTVR